MFGEGLWGAFFDAPELAAFEPLADAAVHNFVGVHMFRPEQCPKVGDGFEGGGEFGSDFHVPGTFVGTEAVLYELEVRLLVVAEGLPQRPALGVPVLWGGVLGRVVG